MKIFISWAGDKSRRIGEALRNWLPNVHQKAEIFFSPNDIEKGAKWSTEIEAQLQDTRFCLVCLTPEALHSSWINFETGAISKGLGQARIVPILFDLSKSDVSGPLELFQLAEFSKPDMKQVINSLNKSFEEERLSDAILEKAFERWWPDLETEIAAVQKVSPSAKTPSKSQRDLTDEVLLNTREIIKIVSQSKNSINQKAIGELAGVNRSASRTYKFISRGHSSSSLKEIHRLGEKLIHLNSTIGKKGGDSLIELKGWAEQKNEIEQEPTPPVADPEPTPDS